MMNPITRKRLTAETPTKKASPVPHLKKHIRSGFFFFFFLAGFFVFSACIDKSHYFDVPEMLPLTARKKIKGEAAILQSFSWLKRHQTIITDEKGIKLGFWYQRLWDQECVGYGGKQNSKKFKGLCPHNHYPGLNVSAWAGKNPHKAGKLTYAYGTGGYDLAVTAVAALAFIETGNSHKRGRYKKGLRALVNFYKKIIIQDKTDKENYGKIDFDLAEKIMRKGLKNHPAIKKGWLKLSDFKLDRKHRLLQHSLVALSLTELYGVSRDKTLGDTCIAINYRQVLYLGDEGFGFDYKKEKGNLVATTLGIMTLKSAKAVGLDTIVMMELRKEEKEVWASLLAYINKLRGKDGLYRWTIGGEETSYLSNILAIYCYVLLKKKWTSEKKDLSKTLSKTLEIENKKKYAYFNDLRYLYEDEILKKKFCPTKAVPAYLTSSIYFQIGSAPYITFTNLNSSWLIDSQISSTNCANGSWFLGRDEDVLEGQAGSVVFSTAINTLALQLYWRYKRMNTGEHRGFVPGIDRVFDTFLKKEKDALSKIKEMNTKK